MVTLFGDRTIQGRLVQLSKDYKVREYQDNKFNVISYLRLLFLQSLKSKKWLKHYHFLPLPTVD